MSGSVWSDSHSSQEDDVPESLDADDGSQTDDTWAIAVGRSAHAAVELIYSILVPAG